MTKTFSDWGFARVALMGRSIRYNSDVTNKMGIGWGVNGNFKARIDDKSYVMVQGLAGAGIAGSYTLSGELFGNGGAGNMYDGLYNQQGDFKTVPVVGGSAGIEYFFGAHKQLHTNLVLGYNRMSYTATPSWLVHSGVVNDNAAGDFVRYNTAGTTQINLLYASLNAMYDITRNFSVGVEYNTGYKQIVNTVSHTAAVNRVAAGIMVGF
ncbi:hypothetical protein D3C72_983700 [compost metagenome]